MKKFFVTLTIVAAGAFPAIAWAMANSSFNASLVTEDTTSASGGACTHKGCHCQSFTQKPGYYACYCGHMSYIHK